ncbi:competence/damage-inducible protein A [Rubrivirga sp.]|uniref:competence/damage-inducible protein A n=1 Tax=Rubrivirga sp. TaxID=1885344 RepID=UPI003C74C939
MTGHLITVGDEILLGQIVDTNAAWLGEQLAAVGVDLRRSETVGDGVDEIASAIEGGYAGGASVVIVTGGLGPTHDDVTRAAVAQAFGRDLEFDQRLFDRIEARYSSRGRTMPAIGRVMAEVPAGFEALENPKGSAPGLWCEAQGRIIAVMPGVPHEMKTISEHAVLPRLVERQDEVVLSRTLLTVGKGESDLSAMIAETAEHLPDGLRLAYLPSLGTVRIRVTARGADHGDARADLEAAICAIRDTLGTLVFGEGQLALEGAVLEMLVDNGLTVAVAESCSGGAVAARLTSVPGSSRAFLGGVVAYSNAAKVGLLGVEESALEDEGAVSEAVALQLAAGARSQFGADVGLATTGIAGPGGGTPNKPVGTVWLAYDDGSTSRAVRLQLTSDREVNIALTATAALDMVRRQVLRRGR